MQEAHHGAESLFFAKAISSAGAMGLLAGIVGFMFWWPKTAKEGFCRLFASGLCSHLFGDAVMRTIVHYADWIPQGEIRAGAYLLAGLPGWFLLGALIRYFKKNQSKDAVQIIKEAKDIL
jgi:hypothetical protein